MTLATLEHPRLRAVNARGLALARELGDRARTINFTLNLGISDQAEGRLDEAAAQFEAVLDALSPTDRPGPRKIALGLLGGLRLQQGRFHEALALVQQANALTDPSEVAVANGNLEHLVQIYLGLRDLERALAAMREQLTLIQEHGLYNTLENVLSNLLRIAVRCGDATLAAHLEARLQADWPDRTVEPDERAEAEALISELGEAERHTAQHLGRKADVQDLLEATHRAVDNLAFSRLTARERELWQHVAVGATNKEIADSLGLSRATVRNYVSELFGKLGVRTRAEAVTLAARRGR